jgi:23S rRNA pseudouridine2605 synthase
VDGRLARSEAQRVDYVRSLIAVDGRPVAAQDKVYIVLNKPRGLVTTRRDPQQRETVYDCLPPDMPFLSPVGRLDKASEGLLFLTNDTQWADYLLNPASGITKTYHVKIDLVADAEFIQALAQPVMDQGELLSAVSVRLIQATTRSSWVEVVLAEGRNRQVRRMMAAQGAAVLRLVRVAIGPVELGDLPKGASKSLTQNEVKLFKQHARDCVADLNTGS